jgi:hypothetical protein
VKEIKGTCKQQLGVDKIAWSNLTDDSSLADRGPRYAIKRDETLRLFATFRENFKS